MLQNKIYQNFAKEIIVTFFIILFGLSIIAWTARAVNFLDLIVENGYSVPTYFQYSVLNLFGILTKFIPLALLISLVIFITKQNEENEFTILWTSGVKKIKITNLFFIISVLILFFYLTFSTFFTPLALNKSRSILAKQNFNSFLPTIRVQSFNDSFKGFTFLVEQKNKNLMKNVFIHDNSNTLKNLTSQSEEKKSTIIIAKSGIVEEKKMILFDGEIITTKAKNKKNDMIKFQQLNIDLKNLRSDTIVIPKLQETHTTQLINCITGEMNESIYNCKKNTKNEIITVLNRRLILPLYILLIPLLCSFLLLKSQKKINFFSNKYSIFGISFLVLLFAEIVIRYTGISKTISILFFFIPIVLIPFIYFLLMFNFSRESYRNE
tara:strand:- start:505 stop:1644 length:1140 start_codon:yes stop_codon:yes gene_type:complete